jgi:DNA end-binding protein Ku
MRSIWKGSIGFGLVSIPIKLYSAVQTSSLDLDMLDSRDHAHIKFQRVNENTKKEVPYDKIVKGYKYDDDYVIVEEADFEAAAPEKSKVIEISTLSIQSFKKHLIILSLKLKTIKLMLYCLQH